MNNFFKCLGVYRDLSVVSDHLNNRGQLYTGRNVGRDSHPCYTKILEPLVIARRISMLCGVKRVKQSRTKLQQQQQQRDEME